MFGRPIRCALSAPGARFGVHCWLRHASPRISSRRTMPTVLQRRCDPHTGDGRTEHRPPVPGRLAGFRQCVPARLVVIHISMRAIPRAIPAAQLRASRAVPVWSGSPHRSWSAPWSTSATLTSSWPRSLIVHRRSHAPSPGNRGRSYGRPPRSDRTATRSWI